MIEVTCRVKEYSDTVKPGILIHSHWQDNSKIEVEIDGKRYVVKGKHLIEAVNNCMNTARY
jgi:hypothetical protein